MIQNQHFSFQEQKKYMSKMPNTIPVQLSGLHTINFIEI